MLLLTFLALAAGPGPFALTKPRTLCLATRPNERHLPQAAWLGERFALTWYESKVTTHEQAVGLLEEVGEPVGSSSHFVSTVDLASSVMGRIEFDGTQLGAVWADDLGGQRGTMFRLLDKTGNPKGEPMRLGSDLLPHAGPTALAWNPELEAWGALFTGTTTKPDLVQHHQYLSIIRGAPSAPIRLDEDAGSSISHNAALVARGRCFLTLWTTQSAVKLSEACEGQDVKRTVGGAGLAQSPSLHFDGAHFWVTWSERVKDAETVWLAQLKADGTLVGKATELPGSWVGPVWSTFAVSQKKLNVLVSHPNDAKCAASFITAAAR